MARKSKESILAEKLRAVSECPPDIFEVLGEEAISLVESCERGDVSSIEALCERLFASTDKDKRLCSLVYLLYLGVRRGSVPCAEIAIRYIAKRELIPELATASLTLLPRLDGDGRRVTAMLAIDSSVDYKECLALLPEGEFADVHLYVLHREGELSDGLTERLTAVLGIPRLASIIRGEGAVGVCEGDYSAIYGILNKYPDERWRSFWVKRLYEYAMANDALAEIAPMLTEVFLLRTYTDKSLLHALASMYIASRANPDYMTTVKELYERCRFTGFTPDEYSLKATVREGVYLDVERELMLAKERDCLGGIIEHIRNRFTLTHELSGRDKRARMHHWQTLFSIEGDCVPIFSEIILEETRHRAKRGEGELSRDQSCCQIICRSELTLGEKRYPFVLDLYIDLSYVSATKCQSAEIRVSEARKNGEFTTMKCDFYLK